MYQYLPLSPILKGDQEGDTISQGSEAVDGHIAQHVEKGQPCLEGGAEEVLRDVRQIEGACSRYIALPGCRLAWLQVSELT